MVESVPAESLPPSCSATTREVAFRAAKVESVLDRDKNLRVANYKLLVTETRTTKEDNLTMVERTGRKNKSNCNELELTTAVVFFIYYKVIGKQSGRVAQG